MDFCVSLDVNTGCISINQRSAQDSMVRLLYVNGVTIGLVIGHSDLSDQQLARWSNATPASISTRAATADGNFACIFWQDKQLNVVTDSSASIPVYYACGSDTIVLGSAAQDVADRAVGMTLDPVSVADFIQNGAVCHPFSLYEGVKVCAPGAVTCFAKETISVTQYWVPKEPDQELALNDYAADLRNRVSHWLTHSLAHSHNATVMFSGGEDSRALISHLPQGPEYRLRIIVDGDNREFRLAQKAGRRLGYEVEMILRPAGHYREHLIEKVQWAGAGLDVRHFHVFRETSAILEGADAVIGGLGSDKLFKSLFMGNVSNKQKTGFRVETLASEYGLIPTQTGLPKDLKWLNNDLQREVWQRHREHHEKLLQFRPKTAGNWHTLWPLGGHSQGHSQFLNNCRYAPQVVEPFIASSVYRLAASIPEKYKVDRKLFSAAFLADMGSSAWIPTTCGRIPAITGARGRAVQFCIKSWRVLQDEALKYRHKGKFLSQGPWGSEQKGFAVHSPSAFLGEDRSLALNALIEQITQEGASGVFWQPADKLAEERKVLALQVGALLRPFAVKGSL